MKTSYLMIGLTVLLICFSCNEEHYSAVSNTDHKILLSAEINKSTPSTKAPINSDFTTDFSTGIYAIQGTWKAGATANNINNDNAIVSGEIGHKLIFSQRYQYPIDASLLTFYAYTPFSANVSTLPGIGTSPVVKIPMTGKEDIMWATATGYKPISSLPINPILNYNHKLTQINFIFKSGLGFTDRTNLVTSLLLKSQPTEAFLTVETGNCTFNGSADMELLTPAQQSSGVPITITGTNGGSLMTSPKSSYTIVATIKQSLSGFLITYNSVTFSLNATIGNAHIVTVSFSKTGVNVSCEINPWGNGSGITIDK